MNDEMINDLIDQYRMATRAMERTDEVIEHLQRMQQQANQDADQAINVLADHMDPEEFNDEFGFYPTRSWIEVDHSSTFPESTQKMLQSIVARDARKRSDQD